MMEYTAPPTIRVYWTVSGATGEARGAAQWGLALFFVLVEPLGGRAWRFICSERKSTDKNFISHGYTGLRCVGQIFFVQRCGAFISIFPVGGVLQCLKTGLSF